MSALNQTIRELKAQRNRAEKQAEKLGQAIKVLESLEGNVGVAGEAKPKRKMSASARRKIGLAMKARWAKAKMSGGSAAQLVVKRKGTMSAAGRARVAAAQRARWAKYKAEKK